MKAILFGITLLGCMYATSALGGDIGCGGVDPSVDPIIAAAMEAGTGRHLLQQWRSCNEENGIKINGKAMMKTHKIKTYRHCCVACKKNPPCLAWRYNEKSKACSLYDKEDSLSIVDSKRHTSGWLEWRLSGNNDLETDQENSQNDVVKSEDNADPEIPIASPPASVPLPPSGLAPEGALAGKVIYGRRLNSHMPCRGNTATDASDCQSRCLGNNRCNAWTFTDGFNCGWTGQSSSVGLCYLMADVSPDHIFDAQADESFVSGWV